MLSQKFHRAQGSRSGSWFRSGLGYTRPAATILATMLALGLGIAALPLPPATTTISLTAWYPTNALAFDETLHLYVYASPDVSVPRDQWALLTNFAATNLTLTNLDATGTNAVLYWRIPAPAARMFYYVGLSNFWGTSTSNIANTPAPVPTNNPPIQINR